MNTRNKLNRSLSKPTVERFKQSLHTLKQNSPQFLRQMPGFLGKAQNELQTVGEFVGSEENGMRYCLKGRVFVVVDQCFGKLNQQASVPGQLLHRSRDGEDRNDQAAE